MTRERNPRASRSTRSQGLRRRRSTRASSRADSINDSTSSLLGASMICSMLKTPRGHSDCPVTSYRRPTLPISSRINRKSPPVLTQHVPSPTGQTRILSKKRSGSQGYGLDDPRSSVERRQVHNLRLTSGPTPKEHRCKGSKTGIAKQPRLHRSHEETELQRGPQPQFSDRKPRAPEEW